jgi:hypothetical protein
MEVCGQLHAWVVLPTGEATDIHGTRGWVGHFHKYIYIYKNKVKHNFREVYSTKTPEEERVYPLVNLKV